MSDNSNHFPKQTPPSPPVSNPPKLEIDPNWAQTTRNPSDPQKKW